MGTGPPRNAVPDGRDPAGGAAAATAPAVVDLGRLRHPVPVALRPGDVRALAAARLGPLGGLDRLRGRGVRPLRHAAGARTRSGAAGAVPGPEADGDARAPRPVRGDLPLLLPAADLVLPFAVDADRSAGRRGGAGAAHRDADDAVRHSRAAGGAPLPDRGHDPAAGGADRDPLLRAVPAGAGTVVGAAGRRTHRRHRAVRVDESRPDLQPQPLGRAGLPGAVRRRRPGARADVLARRCSANSMAGPGSRWRGRRRRCRWPACRGIRSRRCATR